MAPPTDSSNANSIDPLPLGHVRQDHALPFVEAPGHLDGARGAPTEPDRDPNCTFTVHELEQADGRAGLAVERAIHKQRIVDPLELDHALYVQVRPRAEGKLSSKHYRDANRPRLNGGVYPRHLTRDDAVAGVDGGV